MKRFIRHFVINTYSLYLVSSVASGMIFEGGAKTIILSGLVLSAVSVFAKPVINLLLLPLNMVTFGLFKFASSAIALYIVNLLIPNFKLVGFVYQGFQSAWIDIPSMNFGPGIMAYISFSLLMSIITSFIYWLVN